MTIQVTITSGAEQSTPVYEGFPFGLRFYVTNDGVPQEGVEIDVQFNVASNGATAYFQTGLPEDRTITLSSGPDGYTNIAGMYANGVEGSYTANLWLWISYAGPSSFGMTNTAPTGAATPTSITVEAGNNQTVAPNTALPTAITVVVYDQYGARWPGGVNVTATAPSTGASGVFATTGTNTKTVTTDSNGWASLGTFTANATDGAFYINLTSSGLSSGKALVTIKTPTAEVCTPPSEMTLSARTGSGWQNTHLWFAGVAQSGNYARIVVNGTGTPADEMLAYSFDATQLAAIKDLAQITSMTMEFWHYTDGASRPNRFLFYMALADRGAISTTQSCSNGVGSTWQQRIKQWTSWTNTGQPSNKLYGFQLKNDNLRVVLQFSGGDSGSGTYIANGGNLIICYINPEGGEEQSLQLCIL